MVAYRRTMDGLYLLCVGIAGICLVLMTLVIPVGVFWRYQLNAALPWPEPLAVLLVIVFTFLAAAACYRARVHIGVVLLTDALRPPVRRRVLALSELLMALLCLFMIVWGIGLVETTWQQVIAEFPFLSVGVTYLPIPIGGAITLLFILERLWLGPPPATSFVYREPGEIN